jgi:hypothetical protein
MNEDRRSQTEVEMDATPGYPPSTALAQRPTAHLAQPMSSDEMQAWWRTAEAFVQSGAFKGVQDVALAYVKILLGRDLGLNPAQAMMSLDLVRGNLQMRGTLLARMVKESVQYDYERVLDEPERQGVEFFGISKRTGEWKSLGVEEFSVEDAQKARIVKPDGAWMTWPRNMCFWRCISNGVKMHCPDLLGGVPVYTEADDFREIPAIGAVAGEVVEPGWQGISVEMAAEIEKVIRRAERVGHAGLLNRGAVQMGLNGQSPEYVRGWIEESMAALDAMQNAEVADSERAHADEQAVREEHDSPQSEEEGRVDEPDATPGERAALKAAADRDAQIEGQTALAVPEELDTEIALARTALAAAKSEREEKERRAALEALLARKEAE